jgi:methionine biosynthesis protein MetW
MDVKQFENRRWAGEDQAVQFRHTAALALIADSGAKTLLDLGSGDGLLLSLLRNHGVTGKGLDLSEEGVAKAAAKGLDTMVYDFGSKPLPFPDGSFDAVVMLDILEHLYDPESVLKEAARVSRKDVVVGVPNFSSLPARIQVLFGRVPENNQPKKGHVFWFTWTVLKKIASVSNLHVVSLRVNANFQSVPFVRWFFRTLAATWPSLGALSFVARFEK